MPADTPIRPDHAARSRAANVRTALVFASIAIAFFVGIIATKWMGGPIVGIGVMGVAVVVFLVFAIGRSLRK
jgi:hypothetical protein